MNHYMTLNAAGNAIMLAGDFYDKYSATLGFNDMSLPWGGLFDIGPHVPVKPPKTPIPYWQTPHIAHRVGKSLDIDQCALRTVVNNQAPLEPVLDWDGDQVIKPNGEPRYCDRGLMAVPKDRIYQYCSDRGGKIQDEEPIHCEFNN
jgi:hypothetical protein